tara:strand:- start:359 stop:490 length:132 start_codon:yes stop_codon:yes gene_type:complete
MPIHLRQFHIRQISEFNKKQNEEIERASNSAKSSSPQIPNFKK